jgi:hypothetical protein
LPCFERWAERRLSSELIFIGERDVSHTRLIALAAKEETGALVSFNHSSP